MTRLHHSRLSGRLKSVSSRYRISTALLLLSLPKNQTFLASCSQARPSFPYEISWMTDRAVAQAVSRWLPTAAARVRVRAACGVCGGQSVIGASFLLVIFMECIHQFTHSHTDVHHRVYWLYNFCYMFRFIEPSSGNTLNILHY
jgi:hypothetical protein